MKDIVYQYFEDHPDAKRALMDKTKGSSRPHRYSSGATYAKCSFCGVARDEIGDEMKDTTSALNADGTYNLQVLLNSKFYGKQECPNYRPPSTIMDIIRIEEQKYDDLLARAPKTVEKVIKKHGLTGESLAILHDTYGFEPEVVAGIVDVPSAMISAYEAAMETRRELSRAAYVPEIISVSS